MQLRRQLQSPSVFADEVLRRTMTATFAGASRTRRIIVALLAILALVAARDIVTWVQAAYPDRGITIGAILLYPITATVVLGLAVVLLGAWIAPAWMLVRWRWPHDGMAIRALRATVIAFFIQPMANAAILLIAGRDASPERFRWALISGQGALMLAASLLPVSRRDTVDRTWSSSRSLMIGLFAMCLTLILLPHIAWSDFASDGVELLNLGRSLSAYVVPRFWDGSLPPADLGMISVAFPVGWLAGITNPGEVAVRLPIIAYGVALAIGVVAVAELNAKRTLSGREFGALLLGTAAVVLTVSLNTAYYAYATDVSSPASIDLLAMVFMLSAVYFTFANNVAWVLSSATLLSLTRPTGPILFAFLAGSIFILERDWRSPRLRLAVTACVTCFVISTIHGTAMGNESSMLDRIRYLRFDDWWRIRFLLIPSGMIPVLSWFAWRRMGQRSRALALMALAYFAFFYVMAFYSLHHFLPAMVLPLAAFWGTEANREHAMSFPRCQSQRSSVPRWRSWPRSRAI